jgi:hypothetical protein
MKTEKDFLQEKQLVELMDCLPNIQAQADRLVVNSAATSSQATALLKSLKQMKLTITASQKDFLQSFKIVIKSVNTKAAEILAPLLTTEENLRMKAAKYHEYLLAEQRKAEAKRAQEEAAKQAKIDALNKKAEAAKTFNAAVKIEEKIEEAKSAALTPDVEVRKTSRGGAGTMSFRTDWKHEVVNAGKVPREFCVPSDPLIHQAVKRGVREIPGVRIFEKTISTLR